MKSRITDPHTAAEAFNRGGTNKVLEIIFSKYYDKMVSYCKKYVKDIDKAEDIVMKVMVKLLSNNALNTSFEEPQNVTYVFKCLFTYSLHYLKDNNKEITDKIPDTEVNQTNNAEYIELETAINSLSACSREVIILYFYCGMDSTQIAELLNKPVSTIKNTKKYALSVLRKKMGYSDEKYYDAERKSITHIFQSSLKTKTLCYMYGLDKKTVYNIKNKKIFNHITKDL